MGEITTSIRQSIGKAQLGHSEPQLWISWRRKQWFPRSSNNPRRAVQDIAVGPQGRCYMRTWQIGVFYPTEVAYRVFPPLNCRGFLPVNTQVFPPVMEQSVQAIQDLYQTLIKELLLLLLYKGLIQIINIYNFRVEGVLQTENIISVISLLETKDIESILLEDINLHYLQWGGIYIAAE